jgi:hypothetical protein
MAWKRSRVRVPVAPPDKRPEVSGLLSFVGTIDAMAEVNQSHDDQAAPILKLAARLSIKGWSWLCFGLGLALFVIFGWLWYSRVYLSPQHVFWSTIDNSLSSRGLTRHVTQSQSGSTLDQYVNLTFNVSPVAHGVTIIKQEQDGKKSSVITESIGTASSDYIRYTTLQPATTRTDGKPYNFSNLQNIWAKGPEGQTGQSSNSFLAEALFGLVLVGNLGNENRQTLVTQLRDKNVYNVSYDSVKKLHQNGRVIYEYAAKMNIHDFSLIVNRYLSMIGLAEGHKLDPNTYPVDQLSDVTIDIDARAHELTSITYSGGSRKEVYSGYGIVDLTPLPTKTITTDELQQRLQSTLY